MEIKEWLESDITRSVIKRINAERLYYLESIISAGNKDEACGIVMGISRLLNIITNLEEGDLND